MKISLNWIKDYIDIPDNTVELTEKHIIELDGQGKLLDIDNLVIGHVLKKEKHPDADKLNICQLDLGDGKETQIVCGAPNVDVDQKVIVCKVGAVLPGNFKIKKSTIRGVDSNGMICALPELGLSGDASGIHVLDDSAVAGECPIKFLGLDDYVLELGLTPNRMDLLSHKGFAYDLAAVTNQKVKETKVEIKDDFDNKVKVTSSTDKCLKYSTRVIKGVKVGESPQWLKSRLEACGLNSINNVVDVTNFILLDQGQPLHAFDLDKLPKQEIAVELLDKPCTTKALDDNDYKLEKGDIAITSNNEVVAIAGVMGCENSAVSETTTNILLEAAVFDPASVRKTSSRLNLRSDSSTRFERGVDVNNTIYSLDKACKMFKEVCGATEVSSINSADTKYKYDEKTIELDVKEVNAYLGTTLTQKELKDIFSSLGFNYVKGICTVPTRRLDVNNKQDLYEEVARVYGYDNIESVLPSTNSRGQLSERQDKLRVIRNTLSGLGIDEVLTHSLVRKDQVNLYSTESNTVDLMMPLSEDKSTLRKSLLNGVLDVVKYNSARKICDLSIYEIGKKYSLESETMLLSGAMYGEFNQVTWQSNDYKVNFYTVKGIIETLFAKLNIKMVIKEAKYDFLHPYKSAIITSRGKELGYFGELHPKLQTDLSVPKVFVFEIDLEELLNFKTSKNNYQPISKFLSIDKDISFEVSLDTKALDVIDTIKSADRKLITACDIFDIYVGEHVTQGHKSLSFRLTLENPTKTLETQDIQDVLNKVIKKVESKFKAKLRG